MVGLRQRVLGRQKAVIGRASRGTARGHGSVTRRAALGVLSAPTIAGPPLVVKRDEQGQSTTITPVQESKAPESST
jgi:hypothetical protein